MALETVDIVLDQTWRLISNAGAGRFRAVVKDGIDALFSIGTVAPDAGSMLGTPAKSLSFDALDGKVWARGAGIRAVLSVTRVVDAGNPTLIVLPDIGLSATTFSTTLAAGADIATITGRIAGDAIDSFSLSDGRIVLSPDRTKLVRGSTDVAPGAIRAEIVTSHPLAANSPKRQSFVIGVTAPALAISGTPDAATVGEFYAFMPAVTGGYGTKSFSLTGSLPEGLSFSSSTGAVTGMPRASGTFAFGVAVSDATGSANLTGKSITIGSGAAGGGITALMGALGVVSPPSALGYGYTPPFTITRQANGSFTTSYSIDTAKPAYANTIYVGLDGNNASDGLTYANRVRSLKQAITRANALGGIVRLLVDTGTYKLSSVVSSVEDSFAGLAITCSLVIECSTPGGRIVSLADVLVPAFAATATDASVFVSTYTTQAVGNMVVDFASLDAKARPKPFRRVFGTLTAEADVVAALNARLAELTAAGNTRFAGASYVDATNKKIYLKRLSGAAPDANVTVLSSAQNNLNHVPAAGQTRTIWLCPELEVWGGVQPFRSVSNSTGNVTVWAKGGGYGYTQTSHGFSVSGGAGSSFAVGTEVFHCGQDGFNYNGLAGVASINFHEIGTKAYSTGLAGDADGSYNASTSHKNCRGVRVGCTYEDNSNRTIHDIEGAQTWNLGIVINPNRFAGNGQAWDASYASGLATLANTSLVFLDACMSPVANSFDLEAYDGGKLFFANMDVSLATNDVSGAGSAIQGYAA